ncbi:siroheme synthase CysG [Methylocaldum szegediense]|uniref:Siroheme synthase n=1 Tax=Methylocaldum szegediense TaxID=73780 RepID=A0ABN8XDG3_9GAMM|nr:siroheme synthase CysG [Methylocaldum szegediense]CAI8957141.1 siroheme synthase [Methylocaldum szegediense]
MDYLPIFLNLKNEPCLIVGGGPVAARKAETLLQAGGLVSVQAPQIHDSVLKLRDSGRITLIDKAFHPEDVCRFKLVVAATDDADLNAKIAEAAKTHNIPVNVVDQPALCTFIFPAVIDRSPVVAAVSSGGAAPVLARILRMRLESWIPPAYGRLAKLAADFRVRVKQAIDDPRVRRRFWENVLSGTIAELVFAGRDKEAAQRLEQALVAEASGERNRNVGMVYLVGAGPGDPDLLTIRALRLIQEADVVVYDRLVSPEILDLVRRDAEKIYAGKQRNQHTLPQAEINRLLADLAKSGKRVVRLKGGDPFIFGRGGEEIETLMNEGIAFQVVPGITAASGCAAYAGIPLTHRDHAQSCTFLTGHMKDGRLIDVDWKQLSRPGQTLVFYMGLQGLPEICSRLIQHGCPADLPAALVQQGTTQSQLVLTGTLATLPDLVNQSEVKAPTLLIIGTVVRLRKKLAWFEPFDKA